MKSLKLTAGCFFNRIQWWVYFWGPVWTNSGSV